jgi:hypothetical protein
MDAQSRRILHHRQGHLMMSNELFSSFFLNLVFSHPFLLVVYAAFWQVGLALSGNGRLAARLVKLRSLVASPSIMRVLWSWFGFLFVAWLPAVIACYL